MRSSPPRVIMSSEMFKFHLSFLLFSEISSLDLWFSSFAFQSVFDDTTYCQTWYNRSNNHERNINHHLARSAVILGSWWCMTGTEVWKWRVLVRRSGEMSGLGDLRGITKEIIRQEIRWINHPNKIIANHDSDPHHEYRLIWSRQPTKTWLHPLEPL